MDHAALQQLLNSVVPQGGGIVTVPAGDYAVTQDLTVPGNTIVQGAGAATRMVLSAGASVIVAGKSNVRLRDLAIDADAHTARQRALVISNCRDVSVDHCWVVNCGGFGIFLSGDQGTETGKIRISNCRLSGKGNHDVIGGGPTNNTSTVSEVLINDNYVLQDCTRGAYRNAIDIVACTRSIITHNIVQGSIVLGGEKIPHVTVDVSHNIVSPAINAAFCQIALLAASESGQADNSHSIRIVGNDITYGQIYVQGQKATGNRTHRVIIQSNIIKGLANHPDPSVNRGIIVSHAKDALVDGNIVDGASKAIVAGDVIQFRLGKANHLVNCLVTLETDPKTSVAS
jgi:hypothetical protein